MSKSIADPVHGSIELSDIEIAVIETRVFQRLREIRQLGLAHYVYPSADYSRFSHSIGVCHTTGQILEKSGAASDNELLRTCRLAALLHDIGHFPFSHAMEHAVQNWIASEDADWASEPYGHEKVGKRILLEDDELNGVLSNAGYDPAEIAAIFNREKSMLTGNPVSSELDGDRIDYLLRTSHSTGLPYGNVDVDYLLSQTTMDSKKRICLTHKALRTADHFLLCRFFDYQQVAYHKTVVGLEWLLQDTLQELMTVGCIAAQPENIDAMIKSGGWATFTDATVMRDIQNLARNGECAAARKAKAIVDRTPPKLVYSHEEYSPAESNPTKILTKHIEGKLSDWSRKFSIDSKLWLCWTKATQLTKVGPFVPLRGGTTDADDIDQAIHILENGEDKARPIVEMDGSMMKLLAKNAFHAIRVYVLCSDEARPHIEEHIRCELG